MSHTITHRRATWEDTRVKIGPPLPENQRLALDHARERVRLLKAQLKDAEDALWSLQKQCPHNNIRQDIMTVDYTCTDCGSDSTNYIAPRIL